MVNGQNSEVQATCFRKNKAKQEGLLAVQTSNTIALDFLVLLEVPPVRLK
jgi:hypothetical protein